MRPDNKPKENSKYQLFVEGDDDVNSVLHLLMRYGYNWEDVQTTRPYVRRLDNDQVLEQLPIALKQSQYKRLGVLMDTDVSLSSRWAQIRGRAREADLELPAAPEPGGTIVPGLWPESRVGFWLMPNNSAPGNLENFLSGLVPESDPTWSYAGEAVSEAHNRGARWKDRGKSTLHTWLAWQETPGLPYGTALRAEFFRHDTEDARRFVAWFRRLFIDP
jgi:hypothetical protein